jgi:hypothetical protein
VDEHTVQQGGGHNEITIDTDLTCQEAKSSAANAPNIKMAATTRAKIVFILRTKKRMIVLSV